MLNIQPRNESLDLCGIDKLECYHESVKHVEEFAYAGAKDADECKCLPSCTEFDFPAEVMMIAQRVRYTFLSLET